MTPDAGSPRRPTPVIGDPSSARERRDDPAAWSMGEAAQKALAAVISGRRDIRRYRSDAVPDALVRAVLEAGHAGPSVGHSQPWRFIVVRDPATRDRAAHLADTARLRQARQMLPERAARLLDLKLEGLREAPIGIVVACDRRVPAAGVLGRATFTDTDLWSCACAIENMWLTARAHGLGMGWVTLFEPDDLAGLLGLPDGVETLGWMCLGWPDERPPEPGLQRAAWSSKLSLDDVTIAERWPAEPVPSQGDSATPGRAEAQAATTDSRRPTDLTNPPVTHPPPSHLLAPAGDRFVGATDEADQLLAPPEALGVLDRMVNRVVAAVGPEVAGGTLVLVGADHPVTTHGISAYDVGVTADVMRAAVEGRSVGAAHARAAGLGLVVVDAGVATPVAGAREARPEGERGDLKSRDALTSSDVERLLAAGEAVGTAAAEQGLVALGEVGVGNTTVAAALTAALLGLDADTVVGLGSGADAAMVERKREVIAAALRRFTGRLSSRLSDSGAGDGPESRSLGAPSRSIDRGPESLIALGVLGGPEIVVLAGVVLGAARAGSPVVLDGLATSVAALAATRLEPSVQAYLVAGQRSRETVHRQVLDELGLEPLLDLRLRAGEGVGASLASGLILSTAQARRTSVRTV